MTELRLRQYQREAIDAVFAAWAGGMRRPAIVLPTGAGKTVVFATLIKEFMGPGYPSCGPHPDYSGSEILQTARRVIVLAHRDELVDQAIAKIRAIAPDLNVGKVKAQDRQTAADVMVCSVQTLATRSGNALREVLDWEADVGKVGLIITDECHHAAAASYKKVYDAFPDALQLGVTATMARGDGVGLGKVWEEVVYSRSILNLISKGHLTDVRTKRVDLKGLDMGSVRRSAGDYASGSLGKALMEAEADTAIARAYREHAGDRQGLVFTPTVETAHAACKSLRESGIRSTVVDGETPVQVRREAYEDLRTGRTQVLVSCMVLTEGFDAPWAEVAVIARPTQSAPLYTQMVGRVLRPWPGKKEALVLDLVGASANKLRTLIDLTPGDVEGVRDGESLAEAVEREEAEKNRKVPAGSLAFELRAREVDSFAGSATAWIRSEKGVMFINCGDVRVFLWPSEAGAGTWDVCTMKKGERALRTPYVDLAIGEAMAWGEAVAEDHQSFGVSKSAAWRKKKPSDAQNALYSVVVGGSTDGMRAGEVSDAIDRAIAGRQLDKYVKG